MHHQNQTKKNMPKENARNTKQNKSNMHHYQRMLIYSFLILGCLTYLVLSSLNDAKKHIKFTDLFFSMVCALQVYLITFEYNLMNKFKNLPNVYAGGLPYIGQFLNVVPPNAFCDTLFYWRKQAISNCTKNNNEPFTVLVRGRCVVVLSSDEDVAFMNSIERKGSTSVAFPKAIEKLLGDTSLINIDGKHHRVLRRIMVSIKYAILAL